MRSEFNLSLQILPFGSISIKTLPLEVVEPERETEMPIYTEPLTTHFENIEITYDEVETYTIPRTTA